MLIEALGALVLGLILAPLLKPWLAHIPGLNWQRTLRTLRPYRTPAERATPGQDRP